MANPRWDNPKIFAGNSPAKNCELRTDKKDVAVGVYHLKGFNPDRYTPTELLTLLKPFNVKVESGDLPSHEGVQKRIIRLLYMFRNEIQNYKRQVMYEAELKAEETKAPVCYEFPTIQGEYVHTLDYKKPFPAREAIRLGLGALFGVGAILGGLKFIQQPKPNKKDIALSDAP